MTRLKHIMSFERACEEIGVNESQLIMIVENGFLDPLLKINTTHDDNGEVEYLCINFFGHRGGKYPQRGYFRFDCQDTEVIFFNCRDIHYFIEHNDDVIETGACIKPEKGFVPEWARAMENSYNGDSRKYYKEEPKAPNPKAKPRENFKEGTVEHYINERRIEGMKDSDIANLLYVSGQYTKTRISELINDDKVLTPEAQRTDGRRLVERAKK